MRNLQMFHVKHDIPFVSSQQKKVSRETFLSPFPFRSVSRETFMRTVQQDRTIF